MNEALAKILWEIRTNQFPDWNKHPDDVGCYPGEENLSWDSLEEKSDDPNLVSKEFFRKLSSAVIQELGLDILTGEPLGDIDEA